MACMRLNVASGADGIVYWHPRTAICPLSTPAPAPNLWTAVTDGLILASPTNCNGIAYVARPTPNSTHSMHRRVQSSGMLDRLLVESSQPLQTALSILDRQTAVVRLRARWREQRCYKHRHTQPPPLQVCIQTIAKALNVRFGFIAN